MGQQVNMSSKVKSPSESDCAIEKKRNIFFLIKYSNG